MNSKIKAFFPGSLELLVLVVIIGMVTLFPNAETTTDFEADFETEAPLCFTIWEILDAWRSGMVTNDEVILVLQDYICD